MLKIEQLKLIIPVNLLLLLFLITDCGSSQNETASTQVAPADIRKSVVAGQFYPANPAVLKRKIDSFLKKVPLKSRFANIIGLVSPHAGYVYSGQTAAYAYKQVAGNSYDAVIIIAPSHQDQFGGASVWNKGAYETPLGLIPVNQELANTIIAQDKAIQFSKLGHQQEHSLEVQLPFLQQTIKNLTIVPMMIRDYSFKNCQRVANAIVRAVSGKKVLLVASTDLYHGEKYDECVKISNNTLEKIVKLEPEGLFQSFRKGTSQACGIGPVLVVEMAAKKLGGNSAHLLHQTNSNDVMQTRSGYVVGYGAIVICGAPSSRNSTSNINKPKMGEDMELTFEDKKKLIHIAHTTINQVVKGEPVPEFKVTSPILLEKRGAFVTIHKNGNLRGCIGYIIGYKPLHLTVKEMAQAAALRDPRFPSVKPAELSQIHLEISVLSPIHQVENVDEIEVGKHGIIIECGGSSGLLLPQVATENNWDRITFLEHTCNKARLSRDSWKKEDTIIKIFSANVFSEDDVK